jgi:hypothetical protein
MRKRTTEEHRREKERRRRERMKAEADTRAIRFVCAKCGGEFKTPSTDQTQHAGERFFVRLGGKKVCSQCARARFRRVWNVWGMNPDAIN